MIVGSILIPHKLAIRAVKVVNGAAKSPSFSYPGTPPSIMLKLEDLPLPTPLSPMMAPRRCPSSANVTPSSRLNPRLLKAHH